MEQIAGIVAEYNPFHNGHAALAQAAREQGADAVVAVMSGNFVQRGKPAVTDKRVRAEAALRCGVDLVLELPLVCATGGAQRFAEGAVHILHGTGCVNRLAFGSECGDDAPLLHLAEALDRPALRPLIRESLQKGMTFARAREQAVLSLLGDEAAALLAAPNNTLAVEYLRAAGRIGWHPGLTTIRRQGVAHDSAEAAAGYASASLLRKQAADPAFTARYVPPAAAAVYEAAAGRGLYPAAPGKLDTAVLSHLRRLSPADLSELPDLSEGLENRFYGAIREASTLEELELRLKTKRYTMARIRRLILAAYLGVTEEDTRHAPPYIRVLGAGPRGREILSKMKDTGRLPVHHSLARLRERDALCRRFALLEAQATDLYGLCLPKPPPCGCEYTAGAVFLK